MAGTIESLESEVLSLSNADRSRLLDRLVASLDQDEATEAAWDALAHQRAAQLSSGTVQSISIAQALASLEAKHA